MLPRVWTLRFAAWLLAGSTAALALAMGGEPGVPGAFLAVPPPVIAAPPPMAAPPATAAGNAVLPGVDPGPDPEEQAVEGPHPRPRPVRATQGAGYHIAASRGSEPGGRLFASWYGAECQGLATANGERFDRAALTAAHRSLPFGTVIVVTNPQNGKSVQVRVNDRGPWVAGRHLDLSEAAFAAIAPLNAGVIPVRVELIDQ